MPPMRLTGKPCSTQRSAYFTSMSRSTSSARCSKSPSLALTPPVEMSQSRHSLCTSRRGNCCHLATSFKRCSTSFTERSLPASDGSGTNLAYSLLSTASDMASSACTRLTTCRAACMHSKRFTGTPWEAQFSKNNPRQHRWINSFRCSASLRRTPERLLVETSISRQSFCNSFSGISCHMATFSRTFSSSRFFAGSPASAGIFSAWNSTRSSSSVNSLRQAILSTTLAAAGPPPKRFTGIPCVSQAL
mmetsp:Transcript_64998/g.103449  ORF Transcript_64998/g.103449 Transcript_64998/m.103449 type:complete len:247 (-) Transcript_64998:31-771(-)